MTAQTCVPGEDQGALAIPGRIPGVVVVQGPEGVKAGDLGGLALLPVQPPEVHALFLQRPVQHFKIGRHKFRICRVEGDQLPACRVFSQLTAHGLIGILKEPDALGRVYVQGNFETLFVEPV